jgi:hypothetical protein
MPSINDQQGVLMWLGLVRKCLVGGGVSALMVGAAEAQISYLAQQRSITASAQAQAMAGGNYYDPDGNLQYGAINVFGDLSRDAFQTVTSDFGPYAHRVSARSAVNSAAAQTDVWGSSSLDAQSMRFESKIDVSTNDLIPGGNVPIIDDGRHSWAIQFELGQRTDFAVNYESNVGTYANAAEHYLIVDGEGKTVFDTGHPGGVVNMNSPLSLAAGRYELQGEARVYLDNFFAKSFGVPSLNSSFQLSAVPELSTMWMMGLGLVAVGLSVRRRAIA